VQSILARQSPDGGFNIYPHGPSEVSASIKAYFALKVAGISQNDSRMLRLRDRILELGGLQAANSYVRINLSLFDLFPREACPSIPPELILLPGKLIYQMSSWSRAIAISLAIVHSANPRRPVPEGFNLDELYVPGKPLALPRDVKLFTVHNLFLVVDKMLKKWEKHGPRSVRRRAVNKCAEWMLERFEGTDGLGAIYPPMQYAIMALDVLGYARTIPFANRRSTSFSVCSWMMSAGSFFSRVSRWSGIPRSPLSHWPKLAARRNLPCSAPSIGCSRKRFAGAATGASNVRMSSRPAGVSNSRTNIIPTSTIPLWCCSL